MLQKNGEANSEARHQSPVLYSHHSGRYNEARYQFVPFIQETFGILGDKGGGTL
jgi:hypothetical protein